MSTQDQDIGDKPTLTVSIEDADEAPVDPADLRLVIRKPDGTYLERELAELDHDGTGEYSTPVEIDQAGTWYGEWRATVPEVVQPFTISARASLVGEPEGS